MTIKEKLDEQILLYAFIANLIPNLKQVINSLEKNTEKSGRFYFEVITNKR